MKLEVSKRCSPIRRAQSRGMKTNNRVLIIPLFKSRKPLFLVRKCRLFWCAFRYSQKAQCKLLVIRIPLFLFISRRRLVSIHQSPCAPRKGVQTPLRGFHQGSTASTHVIDVTYVRPVLFSFHVWVLWRPWQVLRVELKKALVQWLNITVWYQWPDHLNWDWCWAHRPTRQHDFTSPRPSTQQSGALPTDHEQTGRRLLCTGYSKTNDDWNNPIHVLRPWCSKHHCELSPLCCTPNIVPLHPLRS